MVPAFLRWQLDVSDIKTVHNLEQISTYKIQKFSSLLEDVLCVSAISGYSE